MLSASWSARTKLNLKKSTKHWYANFDEAYL
jgi:hypothetical protein